MYITANLATMALAVTAVLAGGGSCSRSNAGNNNNNQKGGNGAGQWQGHNGQYGNNNNNNNNNNCPTCPTCPVVPPKDCGLTAENVKDIIDGYTYILQSPQGPLLNATASRILTDDFTVFSDSINSLANRTLGGPSFPPGRSGFLSQQSQTPPIPNVKTLDYFVGGECGAQKLSWRVLFTGIGSNMFPVKGIIDFDLAPGPKGGDKVGVKTVYSEFNTAAWLRNYGVQCVTPPRQ